MPAKPAFARRGRSLQPGQRSELTVINADGTGREVIFVADEIIEAPNWTHDGKWLIFNAGGQLWRISPDGRDGPTLIDTGHLADLNNDWSRRRDGWSVRRAAAGRASIAAAGRGRRDGARRPKAW